MLRNRSIPNVTVIPELAYDDVSAAADWLCRAFGFTVRLRIANHRIQLNAGDGAIVLIERSGPGATGAILMRIENLDAHHAHAVKSGAHIVRVPADHPFGERQYTAEDCGGHRWTFSQSIADIAPEDWGGVSENL
jgi:uncharacterized glyoxalase superfamily protein PhnB